MGMHSNTIIISSKLLHNVRELAPELVIVLFSLYLFTHTAFDKGAFIVPFQCLYVGGIAVSNMVV